MRSKISAALLIFPFLGFAQPAQTPEELKQKFPDANTVLLLYREELDITLKKGMPAVDKHGDIQVAYINDKGITSTTDQVYFDPAFMELTDIEANTWVYEKEKYVKRPVKEFREMQDLQGNSFYDSHYFKQFRYPDVGYGSVTEKKWSHHIIDPHYLGAFEFSYGMPSALLEYVVNAPVDVEIGYKSFGDISNVKYEKITKGKMVQHKWIAENVKELKSQDFVYDSNKYRPHIFVFIKSYKDQDGKIVQHQGNVDILYKHNFTYISNLKEPPSDAIRSVVDSIKVKNTNEREIVKGIMYWVQDNVNYVAFEDGLGGLIPRKGNLVMDRKFGDCKDMANLLKNMLEYAGIPAYLCWIGTREKSYTYEELPLPYCDNHMIAAVKFDNEYLFLDATGRYQEFGFPTLGIQGKQALISIDENKYDTPFIPAVSASKNTVRDNFIIEVTDKNLVLNGKIAMTGFARSTNAERFMSAGPQNEKDMMRTIVQRGSNKCELLNYSHTNLENRDSILRMDYSLKIHDYVRSVENEMYINLNFDKTLSSMKPDDEARTEGADYPFAFEDYTDSKLIVPVGYMVKEIPEDFNWSSPYCDVMISYRKTDNEVIMQKNVNFKTIYIPFDKIDEWKKTIDKLLQYQRKTVVLEKKP